MKIGYLIDSGSGLSLHRLPGAQGSVGSEFGEYYDGGSKEAEERMLLGLRALESLLTFKTYYSTVGKLMAKMTEEVQVHLGGESE